MSIAIASFTADDIVTDPEAVASAVNSSCRNRAVRKTLQAVCEVAGSVHFILRSAGDCEPLQEYRLLALNDVSHDGFVAMVNSHHQGSVDVVGTFSARGTTFAVLRHSSG